MSQPLHSLAKGDSERAHWHGVSDGGSREYSTNALRSGGSNGFDAPDERRGRLSFVDVQVAVADYPALQAELLYLAENVSTDQEEGDGAPEPGPWFDLLRVQFRIVEIVLQG